MEVGGSRCYRSGCPACDSTVVCLLIAGALAAAIVFVLAIGQVLWLLRNFREP